MGGRVCGYNGRDLGISRGRSTRLHPPRMNDERYVGDYQLLEPIAVGEVSEVWKALRPEDVSIVALKHARDGGRPPPTARARLENELSVHLLVDHSNIVRL